jgi:hypothetical protein
MAVFTIMDKKWANKITDRGGEYLVEKNKLGSKSKRTQIKRSSQL